jgi:UDP-glucose 4-epimerase
MRILITGCAGFIDSHLAEAFLSRGDEVLILDDLSTGSMETFVTLRMYPSCAIGSSL